MKTVRNSEAKTIPSRTTVGLDVGDRHSWFCILEETGKVVAEGRVRTTTEALNEHFTRWARCRVVLEAGTSSAWISRLARAAGHEVIVANPRELRKIHQSDRKNDRTDAQVLARMARFDPQLLAPITHRSAAMQNDLAVVRARDVLVRARTQCVNAVRGLVKTAGGRLTTCSTESFARKVAAQLPSGLESALVPMLRTIEELTEQIRAYDRVIDELASRYPATEILRQITGVGALTAVTYALTLGDSSRFTSSRDIGAYLAPTGASTPSSSKCAMSKRRGRTVKPSTQTLRVALAAFKDRGLLTPAELSEILSAAGCSRHSWEHEVRPELRRSGILRQSRQEGRVIWLHVGENVPPRARRLRDRYLAEQGRAGGDAPVQPAKKFRYGSPKYIKAQLNYEQHVEAQIAADDSQRDSQEQQCETFIDDHYFGVCRRCGRPANKHRAIEAPPKPTVPATSGLVQRANETFGSGTQQTSMINVSNRDY